MRDLAPARGERAATDTVGAGMRYQADGKTPEVRATTARAETGAQLSK
jgi:hypothetical protein